MGYEISFRKLFSLLSLIVKYLVSFSAGIAKIYIDFKKLFLTLSLRPAFFPSLMGYFVDSASAFWKLDFGLLDLVASKTLCCSPSLSLIPNFGLRGVWIHQEYKADYNDALYLLGNGVTLTQPNNSFDLNSKYQAVGLKGGIGFQVPFLCYFDFRGDFGASLVCGRYKLDQTINGATPNAGGTTLLSFDIMEDWDRVWKLISNFETEVGISYKNCWGKCPFVISANYFFSLWHDQNNFDNQFFTSNPFIQTSGPGGTNYVTTSETNKDLQLQGLILKGAVYF